MTDGTNILLDGYVNNQTHTPKSKFDMAAKSEMADKFKMAPKSKMVPKSRMAT